MLSFVSSDNRKYFIETQDVDSHIIQMQKRLFNNNSFEAHIRYYDTRSQDSGSVSLCYLVKTNQEIREYAENYMQENPELFL